MSISEILEFELISLSILVCLDKSPLTLGLEYNENTITTGNSKPFDWCIVKNGIQSLG